MIAWVLFILTLLVAGFSAWCWHDYAAASEPDEEFGVAVMGIGSALVSIPLAFAWVVALIL